jgi:hypothetical protein
MIYNWELDSLADDEKSILFFIVQKSLEPLGYEPNVKWINMLRKDLTFKIIDTLKRQAPEQNHQIFDSLKEKLSNKI